MFGPCDTTRARKFIYYNANKSTAALPNPTVQPRTRGAELCPSCSAHSLPSMGAATPAASFSVPTAELRAVVWTCCTFPAALNAACCPWQHSSTGSKCHTGPGKRHISNYIPRDAAYHIPRGAVWCNSGCAPSHSLLPLQVS